MDTMLSGLARVCDEATDAPRERLSELRAFVAAMDAARISLNTTFGIRDGWFAEAERLSHEASQAVDARWAQIVRDLAARIADAGDMPPMEPMADAAMAEREMRQGVLDVTGDARTHHLDMVIAIGTKGPQAFPRPVDPNDHAIVDGETGPILDIEHGRYRFPLASVVAVGRRHGGLVFLTEEGGDVPVRLDLVARPR